VVVVRYNYRDRGILPILTRNCVIREREHSGVLGDNPKMRLAQSGRGMDDKRAGGSR
jgi:hypothetical protein